MVTVRPNPLSARFHYSWFVGLFPYSWALGGYRGEQWNSVLAIGVESDAFHRTMFATTNPSPVPRKRYW